MCGREPADDDEHSAAGCASVAHHQPAERVHNVHVQAVKVHSASTVHTATAGRLWSTYSVLSAATGSDARTSARDEWECDCPCSRGGCGTHDRYNDYGPGDGDQDVSVVQQCETDSWQ